MKLTTTRPFASTHLVGFVVLRATTWMVGWERKGTLSVVVWHLRILQVHKPQTKIRRTPLADSQSTSNPATERLATGYASATSVSCNLYVRRNSNNFVISVRVYVDKASPGNADVNSAWPSLCGQRRRQSLKLTWAATNEQVRATSSGSFFFLFVDPQ